MTKVVGVDPGLASTGVGIVCGQSLRVGSYCFGCITTPSGMSLPARLDRIFSQLQQLLAEQKPELMVVEDVFSLREYPRSGIFLGQVTGVVMLAAARAGLPCVAIPVREAKQVLTGNGNATKRQLEAAVRRHLEHRGVIRPTHAADALGLAIIGLLRCDRLPGTAAGAGGRVGPKAAGRCLRAGSALRPAQRIAKRTAT